MQAIELREGLGVRNVKDFHIMVQKALATDDEILLDFAEVGRADLSVMQVLMAAFREANQTGKVIKLKNVSKSIKRQLQICGLIKTAREVS